MHETTSSYGTTLRMTGRVAICSAYPRSLQQLCEIVQRHGFEPIPATQENVTQALQQSEIDACIVDEPPSEEYVRRLQSAAHDCGRTTQFLLLPSLNGIGFNVPEHETLRCDVLKPPHTADHLGRALFASVGRSKKLAGQAPEDTARPATRLADQLVGHSSVIREIRERVERATSHHRPVLVHGEAGVGAGITARSIHLLQHGKSRPHVRLRCLVLTASAIELELFGEPGWSGRLDSSAGGTLLLSDIEHIPLITQERLVHEFRRRQLGKQEADPNHVRLLATTQLPLRQIDAWQDRILPELLHLFHPDDRIAVAPLRERRVDIAPLAEHFLWDYATRNGEVAPRLGAEAIQRLRQHDWAGNVRELSNVMHCCLALSDGREVQPEQIDAWISQVQDAEQTLSPGLTLQEMERKLIEATFTRYNGNRELTARSLQMGVRTLSGKLRDYGYPPRGGPGSNRKVA